MSTPQPGPWNTPSQPPPRQPAPPLWQPGAPPHQAPHGTSPHGHPGARYATHAPRPDDPTLRIPHAAHGHYPPPAPPAPPKPSRKKAAVITGAVVAAVGIGLATAAFSGVFGGEHFDHEAVQRGVTQILTHDYEIAEVKEVRCPANQPAEAGHRYTCAVIIGSESKTVQIAVGQDGDYTVERPR